MAKVKGLRANRKDEKVESQVEDKDVEKDEEEVTDVEDTDVEVTESDSDGDVKDTDSDDDSDEVTVTKASEVKAEPNVRIKPNRDIRTYIGDRWYNLSKGKQETVPQTVKSILQKAGILDAL